jgi:creatinine amidohydrolase
VKKLLFILLLLCLSSNAFAQNKGVLLENLTWQEAEKALKPETVVVIPLGPAAKEHGPHLKLKNDWTMAEYYKRRVLKAADVVIAPTVNYHYVPAFLEYPGSTSLRLETARDLIVDICRSLARFGPHRFYVINTAMTFPALKPAAEALAGEGILLHYLDPRVGERAVKPLLKQEGGRHADENETSKILYMDPTQVYMRKAVKDYQPSPAGSTSIRFTRDPQAAARGEGIYSPTGTWGDPTLATREKGKISTEATVAEILKQIETLRQTAPPNTGAAK